MSNKYEELIEIDGWTLYNVPARVGKTTEHLITHDVCPEGFQFEVNKEKGECSVVHWKYHRCQRCKAFPPEGIMALYLLTNWETPMEMEVWETHYARV